MKKNRLALLIFTLLNFGFYASAMAQQSISETAPQIMEWKIDNVVRKALVYIPTSAKTKPTPIIFAFHGHGGTMANMYRNLSFDKLWKDAIFICPQGLNTPGTLTDKEGKRTGWLMTEDASANRDIKFFDAMLKTLSDDYQINKQKIYVTGHSNGGGFTYLLWATRGDVFAAVAPSSSAAIKLIKDLQPKPFMHIMGENDPLVKPLWQKFTYNAVLKLNHCSSPPTKIATYASLYPSSTGNPVILYLHPGGHEYPKDANQVMIDFFKAH